MKYLISFFLIISFNLYAELEDIIPGHSLVQSKGKTLEEAMASAQKSIPKGWKQENLTDMLVECPKKYQTNLMMECDFFSEEESYQVSLPVVRTEL